jgi:hypothetical protein
MIQIGEHRVFTDNVQNSPKGTEFIVRNIIIHRDSGDRYVGCEFFSPVRFGHNLDIASAALYYGYYNELCPDEHGSYFAIETIKKYSEVIKRREPDWEV